MVGDTTREAASAATDGDRWPWRCLGCDGTIYHDGEYCSACAAATRRGRRDEPHDHRTFRDWIRDQTYPSFVTRVATLAGFELSLTAVWLHLLVIAAGTGALPALG